jgi:light-independent protochlorophyllide reductase subunit B
MGFEGANVIFDTWVHPLMMGLEEHLLQMFKGDAEFHPDAAPSHLGSAPVHQERANDAKTVEKPKGWTPDAEAELMKVPFFVRGKARRNTERYAAEKGMVLITVDTLYDAKAHFS